MSLTPAYELGPYVCPGCYTVGGGPCAPGCIDAEIEGRAEYDIDDPCLHCGHRDCECYLDECVECGAVTVPCECAP